MDGTRYEPELHDFINTVHAMQILIIDDSAGVRTAIRQRLELGGLVVRESGSGKDGLESIYGKPPDLVLLDVVMPGMDGISVLRTIRKSYSKLQLPVILVTSIDSSSEIVHALDYGANDYVTKPIDFDVLWARISNQLMQKQAAEYLRSAHADLEKKIMHRTAELNASNDKLRQEIQERLLAQDRLQTQANYDELTGLPNRNLAKDRLSKTLDRAKRINSTPCLAFLDLDNFKYVNDTMGHAAGDELLREAARRLQACVRESDTVARLGGDEFLLILEDQMTTREPHEVGIQRLGVRIIKSFAAPFVLKGHEISISPSMGFAFYPKDGSDGDRLMCNADAAMYRSKHEGKNTFSFYSAEMTDKAKTHLDVESRLRYALDRRELSLYYQPIVDTGSGKIIKAEALLRWNNAELGMVPPEKFIPIAEDTGQIVLIGEWVIHNACEQARKWRDSGWTHMCVTVNVSARQFYSDSNLVQVIMSSLSTNHLPPEGLQLELTEGLLLRETPKSREIMKKLASIGIKLLLDDFGTGYASLSYLRRYRFDSIKIDSSFVSNVLIDKDDARLVSAIIALANSLGMKVVSDGVENRGQLEFLIDAGCHYAQGYLFSEPVQADKFEELFDVLKTPRSTPGKLELVSRS